MTLTVERVHARGEVSTHEQVSITPGSELASAVLLARRVRVMGPLSDSRHRACPDRPPFGFDRSQLAYLNGIEKISCTFCSYATGLIAEAGRARIRQAGVEPLVRKSQRFVASVAAR